MQLRRTYGRIASQRAPQPPLSAGVKRSDGGAGVPLDGGSPASAPVYKRSRSLPNVGAARLAAAATAAPRYLGVTPTATASPGRPVGFEAQVWVEEEGHNKGRRLLLGTYRTAPEAARAYDRAAIFLRGIDAPKNFPAEHYRNDAVLERLLQMSKSEFIQACSAVQRQSAAEKAAHLAQQQQAPPAARLGLTRHGSLDHQREALVHDAIRKLDHGQPYPSPRRGGISPTSPLDMSTVFARAQGGAGGGKFPAKLEKTKSGNYALHLDPERRDAKSVRALHTHLNDQLRLADDKMATITKVIVNLQNTCAQIRQDQNDLRRALAAIEADTGYDGAFPMQTDSPRASVRSEPGLGGAQQQAYSPIECLDCLRDAANLLKQSTVTGNQYAAVALNRTLGGPLPPEGSGKPWPAYELVVERFGDWKNATEAAGLHG